ncbi:MAG: sulfatase-like hydrolase/transferase [Saprospiraceae bacterium]|nr:sulfatase-like hydrolase/transferase [Saprospiraceae bacterium]
MKPAHIIFTLFIMATFSACTASKNNFSKNTKPNIIYILADDLGFGELGIYGQDKIETPNLDELCRKGKIFKQHYSSAPVCAPARYMLLTGKHSGHSYIRGNDEWRERGEVWHFKQAVLDSTLEGQRPMPESEILFPSILQKMAITPVFLASGDLGHLIPILFLQKWDLIISMDTTVRDRLIHIILFIYTKMNQEFI